MIVVLVGTEVFRLYEGKSRELFLISGFFEKAIDARISLKIWGQPLSVEEQRARKVVIINFPRLSSLTQSVKQRNLVLNEKLVKPHVEGLLWHQNASRGSSGECKESIRPGRSG